MGTVSTALSEEALSKCLKKSIYEATSSEDANVSCEGEKDDFKCSICQVLFYITLHSINENVMLPIFLWSSLDVTAMVSRLVSVQLNGIHLLVFLLQEEYVIQDEVGRLQCEHRYHMACIQQWLRVKNWCPICKASAEPKQFSSLTS